MQARVRFVDVAKGLSLSLVVAYHVWEGLVRRQPAITGVPGWFDEFNRDLAMARVPLFFFVSGLFVERAVKRPARAFIGEKLRVVAWPYAVWSLVFIAAMHLQPDANSEQTYPLNELHRFLLDDAVGQYWFLYALFGCLMFYWAFAKLRLGPGVIVLVAIGLSLARLNFDFDHLGINLGGRRFSLDRYSPLYQITFYFGFMALGAWASPHLIRVANKMSAFRLVVVFAAGAIAVAVAGHFTVGRNATASVAGLQVATGTLFGVPGVVALVALAAVIDRSPLARPFLAVGRNSLEVYVLHVLAAAPLRAALLRAGVRQFWLQMLLGIAVGVGLPLVAARLAPAFRLAWIFRLTESERAFDNGPDVRPAASAEPASLTAEVREAAPGF